MTRYILYSERSIINTARYGSYYFSTCAYACAQITPITNDFPVFLQTGQRSHVVVRSTYWQELALAQGTIACAMAANQSFTVNVGALSNAIAVAIQ